jgi:hypothetical protein
MTSAENISTDLVATTTPREGEWVFTKSTGILTIRKDGITYAYDVGTLEKLWGMDVLPPWLECEEYFRLVMKRDWSEGFTMNEEKWDGLILQYCKHPSFRYAKWNFAYETRKAARDSLTQLGLLEQHLGEWR